MKPELAQEIISCLPRGRTLFSYGKDQYAFHLLQHAAGDGCNIQTLRQSAFSQLLEKPAVRQWLGYLGKPSITPLDFQLTHPVEMETYRMSIGTFDGWDQTSRKGVNLVLQMNLNERDARYVEKHIPDRNDDPFEWLCHPIHEGRHHTLAWTRLDVDLETGEALIEEIQNDRLREVQFMLRRIEWEKTDTITRWGVTMSKEFLVDYWERILKLSRQIWDEAMLTASIQFLVDELGIRTIYYHTPQSGVVYKGAGCENAPTSLYTRLPRKFCFSPCEDRPSFLKKRRKVAPFLKLDLST